MEMCVNRLSVGKKHVDCCVVTLCSLSYIQTEFLLLLYILRKKEEKKEKD